MKTYDANYLGKGVPEEVARLLRQGQRLFEKEQAIIPSHNIRRALDIGCGPGGWVLNVAGQYPDIEEVIGVDGRQRMLDWAESYKTAGENTNGSAKVRFAPFETAEQLTFPEQYFDLIHCCFGGSFLPASEWTTLIQTCFRLLRPGGYLFLMDMEAVLSNSEATQHGMSILYKLLRLTGHSFSTVPQTSGIAFMFQSLLHKQGFADTSLHSIFLDASPHSSEFQEWKENLIMQYSTFRPFILQFGVATEEELDQTLSTILHDMTQDDYVCLTWLLCALGRKPTDQ